MKTKILKYICAGLLLACIGVSNALPPFNNGQTIEKLGFVCGTTINGLKNCPLAISQGRHEDVAKTEFLLSITHNPECEMNPDDITCSDNAPPTSKIYLMHTVFIDSNHSELVKVQVVANQNGSLSAVKTIEPLTTTDITMKNELVALAEAHEKMVGGSVYSQSASGKVVNQYAIPLRQLPSLPGSWSGKDFPFGCATATDALTANTLISQADGINGANCASRLKDSIQHSIGGLDSDTMFLVRAFDNVSGSLGAVGFNVSLTKLLEAGITVVMLDNSRVAYDLKIDAGGALIATLNLERSTTANGTSFEDFKQQAQNAGDPFARGYGFSEMVNYLALTGLATQCDFVVAGYRHVVDYTSERQPDGSILITILSHTASPHYIRNCGNSVRVSGLDVP